MRLLAPSLLEKGQSAGRGPPPGSRSSPPWQMDENHSCLRGGMKTSHSKKAADRRPPRTPTPFPILTPLQLPVTNFFHHIICLQCRAVLKTSYSDLKSLLEGALSDSQLLSDITRCGISCLSSFKCVPGFSCA